MLSGTACHSGVVSSMAIASDNRMLLTAGADGNLKVWSNVSPLRSD